MGLKINWKDLSILAPILLGVLGRDKKLGGVIRFAQANPNIVNIVEQLGNQIIHAHDKHEEQVATGAFSPQPPPPPPTPVGGHDAPPDPWLGLPPIVALEAKLYFVEKKGSGGQLEDKDHFDEIRTGRGNGHLGDRYHFDVTPVDATGARLQPGDPRMNYLPPNLANDRGAPVTSEWECDGVMRNDSVGLSSEYDDYGCTPVLRPFPTTDGGNLDPAQQHQLTFWAWVKLPDGSRIESNKVGPINLS